MKVLNSVALLIAAVTLFWATPLHAEENDDQLSTAEEIEQLKLAVEQLKSEVTSAKKDNFYAPHVNGVVFTSFSVSGYDGDSRFNVRNTRLGVKGNAAKELSYAMQVDFHNQGSISVLDAYVRYKHDDFDFTLGQQHIHLSTESDRGPSSFLFNTRSYASILATAYYDVDESGAYSTSSLGSRDIGAYASYTFDGEVPISVSGGVFNGLGINNVAWSSRKNYIMRIMAGSVMQGFRGGASYYLGENVLGQEMDIFTGELSYKKRNLYLEGQYQQRRLESEALQVMQVMQLGYLQGYYTIPISESKIFSYISPRLRWDWGDDLEYLNLASDFVERYNVNRFTPQVNIGFNGEKIRSHIGVSYEKIMMSDTPSDISVNPLMQDKFTIAFVAAF